LTVFCSLIFLTFATDGLTICTIIAVTSKSHSVCIVKQCLICTIF